MKNLRKSISLYGKKVIALQTDYLNFKMENNKTYSFEEAYQVFFEILWW
jgi:hypothetical protein